MARTSVPVLPIVVAIVLATAAAAEDGWRRVDFEDGILVESRAVEGSRLREVRATTHATAAPAAIAAVLWKHEEFPQFLRHVKAVRVLRDGPDERLVYEEIAVPIAKDRDIVVRARRTSDPATGTIDLESTAVNDEGPPETSRYVRVHVSVGRWHLVPAGGGTDVVYAIRTDIGGYVPDWIANRIQHQTVPELVRAVLDRAERRAPAG